MATEAFLWQPLLECIFSHLSQSVPAAMTKCHWLGGLWKAEMYFSWFWSLRSPRSGLGWHSQWSAQPLILRSWIWAPRWGVEFPLKKVSKIKGRNGCNLEKALFVVRSPLGILTWWEVRCLFDKIVNSSQGLYLHDLSTARKPHFLIPSQQELMFPHRSVGGRGQEAGVAVFRPQHLSFNLSVSSWLRCMFADSVFLDFWFSKGKVVEMLPFDWSNKTIDT